MKKIFIHILSLFFVIIILVSSTGILLIHHHCNHCGKADWHLFSINNCQYLTHHSDNCSFPHNHILNSEQNNNSCNSYDEYYLKIATFNTSDNISLSVEFSFLTDLYLSYFSDTFLNQFNCIHLSSDNSPPWIIQKIFILNRVLRT